MGGSLRFSARTRSTVMAPMAAKRAARKGAKKAVKKAIRKSTKKTEKKVKGGRKSKAASDAGAKRAAAMKKAGKGIFAPKTLSPELAAVCGGKKVMPRTDVTKAIWVYIKKHPGCQAGRIIKPDATLKKVFPVAQLDMLKMGSYV